MTTTTGFSTSTNLSVTGCVVECSPIAVRKLNNLFKKYGGLSSLIEF